MSFFTIENRAITVLAWEPDGFTRYPLDIYGRGINPYLHDDSIWLCQFLSGAGNLAGQPPLAPAGKLTPAVALLFSSVAYSI